MAPVEQLGEYAEHNERLLSYYGHEGNKQLKKTAVIGRLAVNKTNLIPISTKTEEILALNEKLHDAYANNRKIAEKPNYGYLNWPYKLAQLHYKVVDSIGATMNPELRAVKKQHLDAYEAYKFIIAKSLTPIRSDEVVDFLQKVSKRQESLGWTKTADYLKTTIDEIKSKQDELDKTMNIEIASDPIHSEYKNTNRKIQKAYEEIAFLIGGIVRDRYRDRDDPQRSEEEMEVKTQLMQYAKEFRNASSKHLFLQ